MPVFNAITGRAVGEELSSTYEGRHLSFYESELTHPARTGGFVNKGDPVNVGDIVGVAFGTATASTDLIAIDTEGCWVLNVVASDDNGTSAVAAGDQLFINTGVVSKKSSGIPFGKALSVLTGSATAAACAVKVHAGITGDVDPSIIVVSKGGNDTTGNGSWDAPLLTLAAARALVTTSRKAIYLLPGTYTETVAFTWPNINGLEIIGLSEGGSVVIAGPATTPVITINPTFTASFEAFLENVCIKHTAQTGIEIDNANMTNYKLIVHLTGVSSEQVSTGDSINVTHTVATQAIRVYAKRCDEIEGLVDVVVANASDRFRFEACTLIGGLTTAGAVAGEITLLRSTVLASGLTIGSATQVLTYVGSCYRTDDGVFTQLSDTYST